MSRKYSRQQAEEILRRALEGEASKTDDDAIGHSDLRAAAQEVGISEEALEQAAAQIASEQKKIALQDTVLLRRQRQFRSTALGVAVVGVGVVGFGLLGGAFIPLRWLGVAALVWLGLRAKRAFIPSAQDLERAAEREGERELRRTRQQNARQRRMAQQQQRVQQKARTKEQFERVLSTGIDALLTAAADKLEEMSEPERRPRGHRAGPKVRVDPSPTVPEAGMADTVHSADPHDAARDPRRDPRKGRA